jgi:hypothetical protein
LVTDACGDQVLATTDEILNITGELSPKPLVDEELMRRVNEIQAATYSEYLRDHEEPLSSDQQLELSTQLRKSLTDEGIPVVAEELVEVELAREDSRAFTTAVFAELAARQSAARACLPGQSD